MLITGRHRVRHMASLRRDSGPLIASVLLAIQLAWGALPATPALTAPNTSTGPQASPGKSQVPTAKERQQAAEAQAKKAQQRAAGIAAIAARLHVGQGSVVADIGAGGGQDSWVFAGIVGPCGGVYAEEVTEKQIAAIRAEAGKRKLSQIRPLLGRDDDQGLPQACVDPAYIVPLMTRSD